MKRMLTLITATAIFITALPLSALSLGEESAGANEISAERSAPITEEELNEITEDLAEEEAYVLSEIESKREPNVRIK